MPIFLCVAQLQASRRLTEREIDICKLWQQSSVIERASWSMEDNIVVSRALNKKGSQRNLNLNGLKPRELFRRLHMGLSLSPKQMQEAQQFKQEIQQRKLSLVARRELMIATKLDQIKILTRREKVSPIAQTDQPLIAQTYEALIENKVYFQLKRRDLIFNPHVFNEGKKSGRHNNDVNNGFGDYNPNEDITNDWWNTH